MIIISERENGTRRVSLTFSDDVKEVRRKGRDRSVYVDYYPERSKAKPEFAKDANINRLMAKYKRTGIIDPLIYRDMKYGDFASGSDFAEMAIKVTDAQEEFLSLPSHIRNRFQNNPVKLLDFLADPKNDEEAIKLGLKDRPKITHDYIDGYKVVYKDGKEIGRVKQPPTEANPSPVAPAVPAAGASGGTAKP